MPLLNISNSTSKTMEQGQYYARCLTCKDRREVKDANISRTKNNHYRVEGTCTQCGKKVSSFISPSKKEDKAVVESGPTEAASRT